jgi:hypothetical protein
MYGNTDHLLVIRNGQVVLDERFQLDYRAISRGKKGPIGCGIDACTADSALHEFNYLHPDYHPWYRGSDLHTLNR